jgi:hypothetical protein
MLPQDPYPQDPDFDHEGSPTPAIPSPPFDPKPVGDDEVWDEDGGNDNDENGGGGNGEDEFEIL